MDIDDLEREYRETRDQLIADVQLLALIDSNKLDPFNTSNRIASKNIVKRHAELVLKRFVEVGQKLVPG
ncbi:hypothetical protein [Corallococcus carmarthensis]|uniref:hypothetical protein n=1 Tax=Corallococcus carmarthensis TaxID=2316728 RepID=UPI00142ED86C|nr:hypothetical protein [Corallococcus carmarthensis]